MVNTESCFVIMLGLLVGSFINVLIYRIPRKINFIISRSKCESCGALIRWYQNIPVISFIILWGRCAYCEKKISWRHPFIEVLISVGAYLLFQKFFYGQGLLFFFFFFVVFCALVIHFFIDIDFQILPDGVNLFLAIIFLVYSLIFHSWAHWLWGGLLGFGLPYGITWLFHQMRGKIGMGGGDIKLYGALGLYLGPQQIVATLFLSCLLGSLLGICLVALKKMNRETPMAFGPCIIAAAAFQIFFSQFQDSLIRLLFAG